MSKLQHITIGRVGFGLLGLSALLTEIIALISRDAFQPANFFSYFTIISNILAVFLLLWVGGIRRRLSRPSYQVFRGAVTLYMLMTGVLFSLLLAGIEGATLTAVPWDNIVLHYIMPIVIVTDWVLFPPAQRLRFQQTLPWLGLPAAYVGYTLIRGQFTGWYPYPFLNPNLTGTGQFFLSLLLLSLAVVAASWLLHRLPIRSRR